MKWQKVAHFLTTLSIGMLATHAYSSCPDALKHNYKKLHSEETIELCSLYQGKPVIIVNTASHCGYTKQLGQLEDLYQKYKQDGVEIIGFSSDSFNQAASNEEKAAEICYKNFGVTFTMLAPTAVKGKNANPTFKTLAEKSKSPTWNFNKYLVTEDKITRFGSNTSPVNSKLETQLQQALTNK